MKHGTKKKQATHYTDPAPEIRDLRVRATNEWMRRYIEEPERFNREFETVALFQAEENAGVEPSYGERCEAYLEQLIREIRLAELDTELNAARPTATGLVTRARSKRRKAA